MPKFKENLWSFLSEKTFRDFDLAARLNMALNIALEVQKLYGDEETKTAHRDLKPSNIMLDETDNLRIIDVGMGRFYGDLKDRVKWGSCGTVAFVAPEQFACFEQSEKVDIWALGKIIALTIFEWSFGWQLLWSRMFLKPDDVNSLGPLVKLIDLVKDMIEVSFCYT